MNPSSTPARSWVYGSVVLVAPFAALATGDAAPVIVALPFLIPFLIGWLTERRARPDVEFSLPVDRVPEHTPVAFEVGLRGPFTTAHLRLQPPDGLLIDDVEGGRLVGEDGIVASLVEGHARVRLTLVPVRWGAFRVGEVTILATGPFRMRFGTVTVEASDLLTVLPGDEKVRRLVEPVSTNMHVGDLMSGRRGAGIEPAALRPWVPGDPVSSLNWRASARSGRPWVTERHVDRSGDLVIVLDWVVARSADVEVSVREVSRIAGSLVAAYGATRHRLGLLSLGGRIHWFGLGSGPVHEHRLLGAILEIQATASPVWMAVDRLLPRAIRPPSMVVFVTPLIDEGVAGRIRRLALAGIDVAVIGVDPTPWLWVSPGRIGAAALRLWRLERDDTITRLRRSGVGVGEWKPGRPLGEVLEEVETWRRRLRRLRA